MSDEEYETVEEARVRAHVMSNAIVNGDANTVRFLLDSGTDPNIKDRFEETPLTSASNKGLSEIVKILLEYGADPNIKNRFEWTSVMIASYNGLTEIVELLLDNEPVDANDLITTGRNKFLGWKCWWRDNQSEFLVPKDTSFDGTPFKNYLNNVPLKYDGVFNL